MDQFLTMTALLLTVIALGAGAYVFRTEPPRPSSPILQTTTDTVLPEDSDNPLPIKPAIPSVIMASASLSEESAGNYEFHVSVRIAPGWHICSMEQGAGNGISSPTTLEIELPEGLEQVEPWAMPEPDLDTSGAGSAERVYTGEVLFRCRLKRTDKALATPSPIGCRLGYQACNRFSCKPYETVTLSASFEETHQNNQE